MWKSETIQKIKHRNKAYAMLITTVVFLMLFSQLLVQYVLNQKKNDAYIINIVGRQRMLSQKIAKLACRVDKNELSKSLEEWNTIHKGLQNGDSALGLPKLENEAIKQLFLEINPYQLRFYNAVNQMIMNDNSPQNIEAIYKNEALFLPVMENIVKEFELISEAKLRTLMLLELTLAILSMFILAFEILYIVRPAFKKITLQNEALRKIAWSQSHEVRKPVATILGILNLMKDTQMTDEQKELLQYLIKSTEELDQVIHKVVRKVNDHE